MKNENTNTLDIDITSEKLAAQLIEVHGRNLNDYIEGVTMPKGVQSTGNIVAWDDYCTTLAYMQITANQDDYDTKYSRCILYFKLNYERLNIFRLLYLQITVADGFTKTFISKRLNLSRSFVHKVISDSLEEGWVKEKDGKITLTQHSIEAFRHYASKWWNANENSGLSGQYFRVWHSRNAVFVKDNIRNQYLQKYI